MKEVTNYSYGRSFAQHNSFLLVDALRGFCNASDNLTNQSWNGLQGVSNQSIDTIDKREARKYYWSPEELSCPQSAAIGPPSGLTQPSSSKPWKKEDEKWFFYTAVDRWCCIRWSKLIFPGLTHPSFSKHFIKIKNSNNIFTNTETAMLLTFSHLVQLTVANESIAVDVVDVEKESKLSLSLHILHCEHRQALCIS